MGIFDSKALESKADKNAPTTGSVKLTSASLGISENHVRHLLRTGKISGSKQGGRWVVADAHYEPEERKIVLTPEQVHVMQVLANGSKVMLKRSLRRRKLVWTILNLEDDLSRPETRRKYGDYYQDSLVGGHRFCGNVAVRSSTVRVLRRRRLVSDIKGALSVTYTGQRWLNSRPARVSIRGGE